MCRSFYFLVRYEIYIASQDVIIASQIAMRYRLLATLCYCHRDSKRHWLRWLGVGGAWLMVHEQRELEYRLDVLTVACEITETSWDKVRMRSLVKCRIADCRK